MTRNDAEMLAGAAAATAYDMHAGAAAAADDEGQDWLGCEGLHPLTWLPAPAVVMAGGAEGD